MKNEKVTAVLIGASGYGNTYLKELLFKLQDKIKLSGVVDITPENSDYYDELLERKIPIYKSLDEFYEEHEAQLAIVSTPIHLHKEHSCIAMENGSHVLCEKPIAIDIEHIKEMKETSERTNKFLAVGFNWSFAKAHQKLKEDIIANKFGKAKRFKSLTLWPRTRDYYARSAWAGMKISPEGELIYDSIASNAAAHYLHHLLYMAGPTIETSAEVSKVTAELYKINEIDTFDTCAVKMKTSDHIEMYYYASHAVQEVVNPRYVLEFEKATISYDQYKTHQGIIVQWNDGESTTYNDPNTNPFEKIEVCRQAILKGHHDILCGIEASTPHIETIHAMHQSMSNPKKFPKSYHRENLEKNLLHVENLENDLESCFESWEMPTSLGIEWSESGEKVSVKNIEGL